MREGVESRLASAYGHQVLTYCFDEEKMVDILSALGCNFRSVSLLQRLLLERWGEAGGIDENRQLRASGRTDSSMDMVWYGRAMLVFDSGKLGIANVQVSSRFGGGAGENIWIYPFAMDVAALLGLLGLLGVGLMSRGEALW